MPIQFPRNLLWKSFGLFRFVAVVLLCLSVGGCSTKSVPTRAPMAAQALKIVVIAEKSGEALAASERLQKELARAGYLVLSHSSDSESQDAVDIELRVTVRKAKADYGPLRVTTWTRYLIDVDALVDRTVVVDSFHADSTGQSFVPSDVSPVARALQDSPVLGRAWQARHAREREAERRRLKLEADAAERRAAAAREREERAQRVREEERLAWEEADPEQCRTPKSPESCDGVSAFVASHPQGEFHDEAARLLGAASAEIERLRDELAWKEVDVKVCASPKHSTDCNDVVRYLNMFPAGLHVPEADAAIKKSERRIALLSALEEQADQQRRAREAKAADLAQQQATLPPTNSGGSVYVRGYTRKDGTYVRSHTRRK